AVESRWPPRSPRDALLSSPSGRSKIRQYYDRTSPSPSPLKKSATTPDISPTRRAIKARDIEVEGDEDEEILQLQLQALEAKLKLKRLQKRTNAGAPVAERDRQRDLDNARKENVAPSSRTQPEPEASKDVQIPVSPRRKPIPAPEARSPGRVLLGIDKGLKGRNISLRRPTYVKSQNEDPFVSSKAPSVAATKGISRGAFTISHDMPGDTPGKSFSEKIAASRQHDRERKEREVKRFGKTSTGFGLAHKEIDALKVDTEEEYPGSKQPMNQKASTACGGFSREEVLEAMNKPYPGSIPRRETTAGSGTKQSDSSTDAWRNPNAEPDPPSFVRPSPISSNQRPISSSPQPKAAPNTAEDIDRSSSSSGNLFETFSMTHLSKRLLPKDLLTRSFSDKSILRIPDLLATIKSPDYSLPDNLEADYVVLGIIASKSSPLSHKDTSKTKPSEEKTSLTEATASAQNSKGKYMVLTLTDLKWTLDLYLFTTAYTRFWKLVPGTVIALLNPNIMPPPAHKADTGRFSLTLNSSDDTVLEIGTSRDLGWCKAVRKDGKQCPEWIDKRHTEFCEFHVDRVVERTRRGRMEVQGMSAPFAPGGRKQGRTGYFGGGGKGTGPRSKRFEKSESKTEGFRSEGQQYDRLTSSRYFVAPAIPGRSAAQLLDAEGMMTMRGESKEERVRKRLAEREKENEIARKLGDGGNGAGSEYLRLRQPEGGESHAHRDVGQRSGEAVDAGSLGLLGNKARTVHLSPVKGVKRKGVMGVDMSARKKTRFVTERGIRVAGRESLSGPGHGIEDGGDEDEDDLEIE
ncbi:MAG: hypothetical protein Q9164_006830, partial [Protoblastenia rupestris]